MEKLKFFIFGIVVTSLIFVVISLIKAQYDRKTVQWNDIADVEDVLNDVREVLLGNVDKTSIIDTPMMYFYRKDDMADFDSAKKTVEISDAFTLHDDTDGFIRVIYYFRAETDNLRDTIGFGPLSSTWMIHKKNEKWEIVKVFEKP